MHAVSFALGVPVRGFGARIGPVVLRLLFAGVLRQDAQLVPRSSLPPDRRLPIDAACSHMEDRSPYGAGKGRTADGRYSGRYRNSSRVSTKLQGFNPSTATVASIADFPDVVNERAHSIRPDDAYVHVHLNARDGQPPGCGELADTVRPGEDWKVRMPAGGERTNGERSTNLPGALRSKHPDASCRGKMHLAFPSIEKAENAIRIQSIQRKEGVDTHEDHPARPGPAV